MADAARDTGDWAEAARGYAQHCAKYPRDFHIRVQLGHALKESGRLEDAEQAYAAARRLRPRDADLLLNIGHLEKRLGNDSAAGDAYRASFAIDGNADALAELSSLSLRPHHTPARGKPVTAARAVAVKPVDQAEGEWALFVCHARTGALKPHVVKYLSALRETGLHLALIIQADRPALITPEVNSLVDALIVRENVGYDFAAWAHTLRLYPALFSAKRLILANDSLFGPASDQAMADIMARVRASEADVVALTETLERGWHLQSYFLALSGAVLASAAFQQFVLSIENLGDKDDVIDRYEIRFAGRMREAGFATEVLFPIAEARNPTLYAAPRLLDAGFPFVKMLLLRGQFPHIKTANLRSRLIKAGFDMDLLEHSLDYSTDEPLPIGDWPLLAKTPTDDDRLPAKPYRIAFFGPWNYDSGLGAASRAIVGAIRRAGVVLNLHPIKKPFHIHQPLSPPADVCEFVGDADIAVVHLNPDSWHLLTEDQRRTISRARKRIGYWVWEMEHIPRAWREDFSSVDRIWSPSAYCSELFAAQDEAKVDVVPHPVPLPSEPENGSDALVKAGIPAGRRIILYVFDGASYLVRKNPHALVRSFAASGLGAEGWTLVLKAKHLGDRQDDGRRLRELVEATPDVIVLDVTQTRADLLDLVAACDIYASPHCSEGFGLTVAEAMAMGKPVIATDYGGTQQFLDDAVGYPVTAHQAELAEDFGHYTKGGRWAAIDEAELTRTLREVAEAVVARTETKGPAARRRVAADLSFETVGAAIARSFDAVLADKDAIWRSAKRVHVKADAGVAVEQAAFGKVIVVVALGRDGLPLDGKVLAGLADDVDVANKWVVFAPVEARLDPMLERAIRDFAASRPDAALIYGDDIAAEGARLADQLQLKPSFDRWHFAARGFVGLPLVVSGGALAALGGLDASKGPLAIDDLILRALAAGLGVVRIPRVLLAWPGDRRAAPPVADRRKLLEGSFVYSGYRLDDGLVSSTLALSRPSDAAIPQVTVLVPTCRSRLPREMGNDGDTDTFVERLLDSLANTDWPMERLSVIVADDLAGPVAWANKDRPFSLRRIETPRAPGQPFNYAAKMNLLWRAAETRHVVMMNDDVEIAGCGWLKALMTFVTDEAVGGVGARLLFENGRIQHAGVVMGPMGSCIHPWLWRRAEADTYQNLASVHRQCSAVTGAVFATRREVLDEVGGFDERFALEFNDIDLCLRISLTGRAIVYTPHAELRHAEKASRGEIAPRGEDLALFLERWSGWLADDPFYHPGMRRDTLVPEPAEPRDEWYQT